MEKMKNEEMVKKTKDLENELSEEKKKNEEFTKKYKDLEKELNEEKKANDESKNTIRELNEKIKNMPKNMPSSNSDNFQKKDSFSETNKDFLLTSIFEKEREIKELKAKLEKSIQIGVDEELISIIFIEQEENVHYSVICKNTDKLSAPEDKLFKKFPNLKDYDYDYYFNKKRVKKGRNLKENNITNGDILTLKKRDDD